MLDSLKNFWEKNLEEIRANRIRFAAIIACLILAVIVALDDYSSAGEEIPLRTTQPELPAPSPVTTQNNPPATENLIAVTGANPNELYVYNPFQQPPKPQPAPIEIELPEPAEIPQFTTPPPIIPVAQEPAPKSEEKFILRGTAISGNHQSAIINKISSGEKYENLVVSLGEHISGRRVVEISADFVSLEDGTKIFLSP